ncbi:Zinc finger, CCHC-type [Corchorus olitorius]|uniref:Zinc finger, CCHC-type n=1 Tax=Corchorus olitorius TaxID=93759 RepID=A0A1R3GLW6_9ROSI|nr:Zinc finger, CCHC-type [Corchorus olitorius]
MAAKNIIADLNTGEKLNGDNYNIWHRKVQYILRNKSIARIKLVSCMTDELICEFEEYATAQGMWNTLKEKFGNVSDTKLKQLVIKYDNYKKRPENNMRQHLQEMSNMMRELKIVGHVLNDQQVQAVVRSLPRGWEYMNAMLTHNDKFKTFADVQRHLELEEERLMAMNNHPEVNIAQSSKRGGSSHKRKKGGRNVKQDDNVEPHAKRAKTNKRKRGQRAEKNRDKSKVTCYNCGKLGHFAHSAATDHVARSREAYVEYRRIPAGTRWIYMGKENAVEVKGIGTCKLDMRGGQTLFLHDVLHAPETT